MLITKNNARKIVNNSQYSEELINFFKSTLEKNEYIHIPTAKEQLDKFIPSDYISYTQNIIFIIEAVNERICKIASLLNLCKSLKIEPIKSYALSEDHAIDIDASIDEQVLPLLRNKTNKKFFHLLLLKLAMTKGWAVTLSGLLKENNTLLDPEKTPEILFIYLEFNNLPFESQHWLWTQNLTCQNPAHLKEYKNLWVSECAENGNTIIQHNNYTFFKTLAIAEQNWLIKLDSTQDKMKLRRIQQDQLLDGLNDPIAEDFYCRTLIPQWNDQKTWFEQPTKLLQMIIIALKKDSTSMLDSLLDFKDEQLKQKQNKQIITLTKILLVARNHEFTALTLDWLERHYPETYQNLEIECRVDLFNRGTLATKQWLLKIYPGLLKDKHYIEQYGRLAFKDDWTINSLNEWKHVLASQDFNEKPEFKQLWTKFDDDIKLKILSYDDYSVFSRCSSERREELLVSISDPSKKSHLQNLSFFQKNNSTKLISSVNTDSPNIKLNHCQSRP